jgi:putative phosphonate metabolism protein
MNERHARAPQPRAHRYAAYFAPAIGSAWCEAGNRWLGRCAANNQTWPQPVFEGLPVGLQFKLTSAPRRYGWHATLAAPFTLLPQIEESTLREGLQTLCRAWEPFDMPALEVALLDDFLALVPAQPSPALHAVAAACVTGLHAFSEPLSLSELQRRRAAGLTPEEDALLVRWGYPYVLDRFRFHMSLTGSLRDTEPRVVETLRAAARQHFAPLLAATPLRFEAISLFAEPAPGADFVCLAQMALGR